MTRHTAKARIKDFQERVAYKDTLPVGTYIPVVTVDDLLCIPIHPFALDGDILRQWNLQKEDCTGVDAYVRTGGDVIFFQCDTTAGWEIPVGIYARCNSETGYVNIVVIIDEPYMTYELFSEWLRKGLAKLDALPSGFAKDNLVLIGP